MTPDKDYRCQVQAKNQKGWSGWSTWTPTFTTLPATTPGAPASASAAATSPTTAKVSFPEPAANGGSTITEYAAECKSSDGGVGKLATGTASPITVSGLSAGKQYVCKARAANEVGWGVWSPGSPTVTMPEVSDPGDPGDPGTPPGVGPDAPGTPSATGASTPTWTMIDEAALKRTGRWKPIRSANFDQGRARTATVRGAALKTRGKVAVSAISVAATTCKKCGTIVVYYGKKKVARISLKSATTQQQTILLKDWGVVQKAKKIRVVVVSKGRKVTVDSLGVRAG